MKLLLIANHTNAAAVEALQAARLFLESQGVGTESASSGSLLLNDPVYHDLATRVGTFDLVCAFGGDGTLLRAARIVAGSAAPLLGFNYGTVGFLAGATAASLMPALSAALAGDVVYEQRVLLEARIDFSDGRQTVCQALNELSIGRSNFGRSIQLHLSINGDHLFDLRGDGVIIATATGSTAYALAAGGPLLTPGHRGLCVVPVCPHPLATPAIVTAPEDVVELRLVPKLGQSPCVYTDGQLVEPSPMHAGADVRSRDTAKHEHHNNGMAGEQEGGYPLVGAVTVKKSPHVLTLVRYNTPDFYTSLAALFNGGSHAR
ncbi:MAG: NAD(+)/NADH kinase [Coriobacteriales bacterium]|jgi:NAD+ kinase|nr:NAD(+)/NADH kinase [Coriobacteriales bacterium]